MASSEEIVFDVAIHGGGPTACAIARDAVGRGLRVLLCAPGGLGGAVEQTIATDALSAATVTQQDILAESAVLRRICPQLGPQESQKPPRTGFWQRWRSNSEPPPCRISPGTVHRFSSLNLRDAAERGAVLMPNTPIAEFRPDGEGWLLVIDGQRPNQRCRLLVDTEPRSPSQGNIGFAQVAVFDRATPESRFLISTETETRFCTDFCDTSVAIGIICEAEPHPTRLSEVAQEAGLSQSATWVSAVFPFARPPADPLVIRTDPPHFLVNPVNSALLRRFAEDTVAEMAPFVRMISKPWTGFTTLPGGDFQPSIGPALLSELQDQHPERDSHSIERLFTSYGTEAARILKTDNCPGAEFGPDLTEAEVRWLCDKEKARTVSDILWRRSLLGMQVQADQTAQLQRWLDENMT